MSNGTDRLLAKGCVLLLVAVYGCEPPAAAPVNPAPPPVIPATTPTNPATTTPMTPMTTTPSVPMLPGATRPVILLTPEVEKAEAMGFLRPDFKPGVLRPNEDITQLQTFDGVRMTDGDAEFLLSFPNLKQLQLDKSSITDAALATVAKLTKLEDLSLQRCAITDEGIQKLIELKGLKKLMLSGTKINNGSLVIISQNFPLLEEIRMEGTAISDDGLAHLGALKNLKAIYANATYATANGAAKLEAAIPGCRVQANR